MIRVVPCCPIAQAVAWECKQLPTASITTVAARKAREAARLQRAAHQAVDELKDYARREGGTFVVFGSYATDSMRFGSDLDIMLDFPVEAAGDAWRFAEDVCSRLGVPLDIHDAHSTKPEFAARVRKSGLVLA